MRKFWFICRAGDGIGLGHLIRCILLAESLRSLGVESEISVLSDDLDHIPKRCPDIDISRCDLETLVSCASHRTDVDLVIIDADDFPQELNQTLRKRFGHIVSLSPIFRSNEIVDLYIGRVGLLHPHETDVTVKVGGQFAIFDNTLNRVETNDFEKQIHQSKLPVSLLLGGGRTKERYLEIVNSLHSILPKIELNIFTGALGKCEPEDLFDSLNPALKTHVSVQKFMSQESSWNEIGRSALLLCEGGLVAYESVYCGIPFLALCRRSFQSDCLSHLLEFDCGICVDLQKETLSMAGTYLENLVQDKQKILQMHLNSRYVLQNAGANHVGKTIVSWFEHRLQTGQHIRKVAYA